MNQIEQHSTSVDHPVLKAITALLAGLGVSNWSDFAAMCAAIYTICLLGEWLWKKFGRPFAENRGWVRRRKRRADDILPPR